MMPDDDDSFISERKRHEFNIECDAAFCAAMMRAIRYRQEKKWRIGTIVDDRPLMPIRFYSYAAMASCGSPAAMCAEVGGPQ